MQKKIQHKVINNNRELNHIVDLANGSDLIFTGCTFSHVTIKHVNLASVRFQTCTFRQCIIDALHTSRFSFWNSQLHFCTFTNCNTRLAYIHCMVLYSKFHQSRPTELCRLQNSGFYYCDFSGLDIVNLKININTVLVGCTGIDVEYSRNGK